jgi:hypothetical protein
VNAAKPQSAEPLVVATESVQRSGDAHELAAWFVRAIAEGHLPTEPFTPSGTLSTRAFGIAGSTRTSPPAREGLVPARSSTSSGGYVRSSKQNDERGDERDAMRGIG